VNIDGNVGYSQYALGSSGTLNLNGAGLSIAFENGFVPYPGDTFTIVSNNAAGNGISSLTTFGTAAISGQAATAASDGATVGTVTIGTATVPVQIFYPGYTDGATALGLPTGTSLSNVVLHVQGPSSGSPSGPSGPIAVSGSLSSTAPTTINLDGAGGYTQFEVTGSGSNLLNLNNAPLSVNDIDGAVSYGTYTIVNDQTSNSYTNSNANISSAQFAIQGEFSYEGSAAPNGTAITVSCGSNTYVLRIFYPQEDFGGDGSLLKDVILERQTPLQILGTDQPGSSGENYAGIAVDASYPTHSWEGETFYQYQDPGVLNYNDFFNSSVVSNAPGLQRSMISQITITFTGIVDSVDPPGANGLGGAISLQMTYPYAGEQVPLTYSSTPTVVGDRSQVVVNFLADNLNPSNSPTTYVRPYDGVVALENGNFQLLVQGGTSSPSIHAQGNAGLALASNKVDNFYALYGDVYGLGTVGAGVTLDDTAWEALEASFVPGDGLAHGLSYFQDWTDNGQYMFGALSGVAPLPGLSTVQQYQGASFTGNLLNNGVFAGWDPDVVYIDQEGIGYVDATDASDFTSALSTTLPPPSVNPIFNPPG
jgi:hypothetical protein